ncbi:MAG: glutamate synthase (NADH) small subunit [Magnetococcales bacterium]|nr:glutamate synthase (NADH) small subunit [Magnetococcales bacterium]HIJ84445.1 glutamate synthase subunit beta [Magnetococcales bacterium]
MGKATGFMEINRETPDERDVHERVRDYKELYHPFPMEKLQEQASRCMDCGVPFCHTGCSLNNIIPQWNDWVYRGRWDRAVETLHRTNNFPEFTGRVCPAPCESSCVVGINRESVTIREIERTIAEEGWRRGLIVPVMALKKTGKRVAVVGSGPAGLAAAQQLVRMGHECTVLEKNERAGGLLRFGIPDFKLEKAIIDRRLEQLIAEGVEIRTGIHVGRDVGVEQLQKDYDALILCHGAEVPRDLPIPGRNLAGIHFAMDFLTRQNRRVAGLALADAQEMTATGKHVVVIGGGDTGSDCVGTSVRQGALSVTQIELLPKPPDRRAPETPWPLWPHMLRTSSSHREGCRRLWGILSKEFTGTEGRVQQLTCVRLLWEQKEDGSQPKMKEVPDSRFSLKADLVLLAMGFVRPDAHGLPAELALDARGNVQVDRNHMTSLAGVFAAGDMATGQSLVLRAIAGGRVAAQGVDQWLRKKELALE